MRSWMFLLGAPSRNHARANDIKAFLFAATFRLPRIRGGENAYIFMEIGFLIS